MLKLFKVPQHLYTKFWHLIKVLRADISMSYKFKMQLKNKKPNRCHFLFYCTSYRLNMFQALLCPSSGACYYNVDYHIGHFVLGLLYVGGCSLQPRHYCSLTTPNLQHTENQEQNYQCGNQHHSCELLMMGIVMPKTCWAYKKYNKITSGKQLVFYSSIFTMMHGPINIRLKIQVSRDLTRCQLINGYWCSEG